MIYTIDPDKSISLRVKAKEKYSLEKINIEVGQEYEFWCDEDECWVDWIIPSTPDGVCNPPASIAGLRVKHTRCFCLCASYNDDEKHLFPIGSKNKLEMKRSGTLSFFANDAKAYYENNRGIITVNIKRTK